MTREDIIRMAREAGIDAEKDTLCRYEGWVEPIERFAALVAKHTLANIDPSSFMSWQEGYAAGAAAEREACSKAKAATPRKLKPVGRGILLFEQQFCFDKGWREGAASVRAAIRARGNT